MKLAWSGVAVRRRTILLAVTAAALGPARAQAWPTRPIRLVVPFPPGGLNDNIARLIAPRLQRELGQPVVVDNKPGMGGAVGAADVAQAAPDGYTLLIATPPLTINPAIYPTLPYDPARLTAVSFLGRVPNVLLVNPAGGINSVADLIARAQQAPGKLKYASAGNGTSPHLSAELLKFTEKLDIAHVPYRGGSAAVNAVVSGEVDLCFDNLSSAIDQITQGRVKVLAVTTRRRSKILPKVPALAETGSPEFEVSAWFGLAAPTGLPANVKARYEAAMDKIARDPEVLSATRKSGAELLYMSGAIMSSFMAADAAKWRRLTAVVRIAVD